jgi:hypothetical protein
MARESMMLEVLNGAFVLLSLGPSSERTQVSALARAGIQLS